MSALAARLRASRPGRARLRGLWLTFLGPFGLEVLGAAAPESRPDWVGIDLQHGDLEPADIAPLLRASPVPALVRLASHDPAHLARVLDAGADGVIVPAVESAGQAAQLVDAAYLPPRGRRSSGLSRSTLGYGAARANQPLVLPMVETRAGLSAVDQILDIDGIDGIFVGPYDLALSLGEDSVTSDPVVAAIDRVVAATRHRNRVAGVFAGNPELVERLPEVDLLGIDTDAGVLRAGLDLLLGNTSEGRRVS